MTSYSGTLSETVTMTPTYVVGAGTTLTELTTLLDPMDPLTETKGSIWHTFSTDGLKPSIQLNGVRATRGSASDTVMMGSSDLAQLGFVVTERLALTTTWGVRAILHDTLAEVLGLVDASQRAQLVSLTDGPVMGSSVTVATLVTVVESLGLTDLFAPSAKYHLTLTQAVSLGDLLGRFFGGTIAERVGMTETYTPKYLARYTMTEHVGVADTVTPRFLIRVTTAETVTLTAAETLRALYTQTVAENVTISLAYVAPSGAITTWTVNTRTGAATEYSNFAFNSFAQMGRKYIAASSDGLYELLGDDDNGADIIARIKSGFAQMAGSRFTMFKAAYLGVRGGGEYILRLETGDGTTYDYGVVAEDMKTSKVSLGKGLRARYFAFELISSGQDFDLDTVEFVPIVVQRRV